MIEYWIAFPAGIAIASMVSTVGIGGGILWMPFFLLFLKLSPETAVITSLLIQTAGKGSGSFAYLKKGLVDLKLSLLVLATAVPGILVGARLSNLLEPSAMELILGLMLLTTAFLFVSGHEPYDRQGETRADIRLIYRRLWLPATLSVGSGLLSTGIGEWLIPVMKSRLNLRMANAIAASVFITFGTSVLAASAHLLMGGKPALPILAWAIPGVLIGGQIGPRLAQRIDDRTLKEIFIFLLTLVGVHLIYNAF